MSKSTEKFAVEVQLIDSSQRHLDINKSAVILMKNSNYLNDFNSKVKLEGDFYNPLKFIIYCTSMSKANLISINMELDLTYMEGRITLYEYFLINEIHGYSLYTLEWFIHSICNKPVWLYINSYNEHLKSWNKKLKINKKFRNFHGCILSMRDPLFVDAIKHYSLSREIFNAMSKKANFTAHFQMIRYNYYSDTNFTSEYVPSNGYVINMYQVFFTIGWLPKYEQHYFQHITTPFLEDKVTFALAKPEEYSSFEKMILPFDFLTWIFSILIFLTAFACIFIINLKSTKTQDIIYGENVKTPALNVIGIFFGISLKRLPTKNFSRIILMTFILLCLVLRTAYQGVLFTMQAIDIGKPLPQTLDDLYNMNYTIVLDEQNYHIYFMLPENLR